MLPAALSLALLSAMRDQMPPVDVAAAFDAFRSFAPWRRAVAIAATALTFLAYGRSEIAVHRWLSTFRDPRAAGRAGMAALALSSLAFLTCLAAVAAAAYLATGADALPPVLAFVLLFALAGGIVAAVASRRPGIAPTVPVVCAIGAPFEPELPIDALWTAARDSGRFALFYKIGARNAAMARRRGWSAMRIGTEAIVPLSRFDIAAPACRGGRKLGKVARSNLRIDNVAPRNIASLKPVDAEWQARHGRARRCRWPPCPGLAAREGCGSSNPRSVRGGIRFTRPQRVPWPCDLGYSIRRAISPGPRIRTIRMKNMSDPDLRAVQFRDRGRGSFPLSEGTAR